MLPSLVPLLPSPATALAPRPTPPPERPNPTTHHPRYSSQDEQYDCPACDGQEEAKCLETLEFTMYVGEVGGGWGGFDARQPRPRGRVGGGVWTPRAAAGLRRQPHRSASPGDVERKLPHRHRHRHLHCHCHHQCCIKPRLSPDLSPHRRRHHHRPRYNALGSAARLQVSVNPNSIPEWKKTLA